MVKVMVDVELLSTTVTTSVVTSSPADSETPLVTAALASGRRVTAAVEVEEIEARVELGKIWAAAREAMRGTDKTKGSIVGEMSWKLGSLGISG